MNSLGIEFNGATLEALGSGALFWPEAEVLCVSDLHLGKSERMSRRTGIPAPPYEVEDTLSRLESDLGATGARTVICLGDSFDDRAAAEACLRMRGSGSRACRRGGAGSGSKETTIRGRLIWAASIARNTRANR